MIVPIAHRDVENISPLTKDDLLEFFDQYIHPSSSTRTTLSIHLVAQKSTRVSDTADENAYSVEPGMTINECEPPMAGARNPIEIDDVNAWKTSMPLAATAVPVKCLSEFEEGGIES